MKVPTLAGGVPTRGGPAASRARLRRELAIRASLVGLLSACGAGGGGTNDPGVTALGQPSDASGGSGSNPTTQPAVSEGQAPPLGASSSEQPDTSGVGLAEGAAAGGIPCDVAAIVQQRCSLCHGETPQFSAPMSLVEAGDFLAIAPISSQPVRDAALGRIGADAARPMPPPGTVEPLTESERSVLEQWLASGAPPAADGCSVTELPLEPESDGLAQPPASGASTAPYPGWDSGDVECYPLVANAGDLQSPYRVGTATDEYIGFGFMPPWGEGTRYVRAFRAVVDNAQVLHHWLLFQQAGPIANGSVAPLLGAHPDGQLLHGWAPGGTDAYYTEKVGVELEGGRGYLLELHYNSSDPSAVDASGVEVCVTETPPENIALLSWLGTDLINGTRASGVCRPRAQEPIRIISGSPHMHLKGRHMTVTVHRADGTDEVVHDEPFDFENQRMYDEDVTIYPGDTIETTCEFSSPASFGKGTNEEMCYWFAQSYPAGALADGGLLGTLLHGPNSCLGL